MKHHKDLAKLLSRLDPKDIDKICEITQAIADFKKLIAEAPTKSAAETVAEISRQYEKVKHLAEDVSDEPAPVAPVSDMIH
jgi:hypothetical protein